MPTEIVQLESLPLVSGIIICFALCLGLMAILFFRDSHEDTWLVRRYLSYRLNHRALSTVLSQLGINPQQYAFNAPVPSLQRQIRRCERCQQAPACQQALANKLPANEFSFCPNAADIDTTRLSPESSGAATQAGTRFKAPEC